MDYQLETVLEMPDSEISADSPVRMHRRVMSSSTTKSKSTHKEKMTNQIWYLAQAHKDLDRKSLMIQNRLKELHIGNYVDLRWKEIISDDVKKENTSCEIKKTITKAQSPYRNNKKKQVKIEKKRGFQEEIKLIQDRALKNIGNQMSSQAKIPILMSKSRISKEKSKKEQILEKHAGVDYQLTENYAKKRSLSLSETKVYKL